MFGVEIWGGMLKPAYVPVSAGFAFLVEARAPLALFGRAVCNAESWSEVYFPLNGRGSPHGTRGAVS